MGRTPFYRTSIELENHFSNIERTRTCSSIGDRTRTPFFWLRTNEHRTSNLIRLSLNLLNYSSNWLEHHFFEHRTNSNVFIYWKSNSNTLFLPSNDRTSNFEHSSTHHYRILKKTNSSFIWMCFWFSYVHPVLFWNLKLFLKPLCSALFIS